MKKYCPGYYNLATGGLVSPDETDISNALRELEEELGIKKKEEDLKFIGSHRYDD